VALPVESDVVFRLDVPSGPVIVNVTAAPAALVEPCVTLAAIATVEPLVTGAEGTVIETASGSTTTTGFTVRFASASTEAPDAVAIASTAYVAELAPAGTDFFIVVEPDEPGEIVRVFCPKVVDHVPGSREETLKLRDEQDDESLFVTVIVYVTSWPG